MAKASFCSILFASLTLVLTADAQAVFFTSNGTVQVSATEGGNPGDPNPPLLQVETLVGANGRVFTNQVSGIPFVSGEVRSVSAERVVTALDGDRSFLGLGLPNASPNIALVALTAIRGFIESPGVARFEEGRLFLVAVTLPPNFVAADPESYQFTESNIIAEFRLAAPDTVVGVPPQGADVTVVPASSVNVSSINSLSALGGQGSFLFFEDSTAAQSAGRAGSDAALGTGGNNFISDVQPIAGVAANQEGLFLQTEQNLSSSAPANGLSVGDLAVLNAIASRAGFSDLGAPGTGFASGFGSGTTAGMANAEFGGSNVPAGVALFPGQTTSGDFQASLTGTKAHIGLSSVPEPSSMALFGLGSLALGMYSRRRKQQQDANQAAV